MDVTMIVFLVFLRYKKINKIKFIEIFLKSDSLSKVIIINLPRMKNKFKIMDSQ
jgi:hypothetical protein